MDLNKNSSKFKWQKIIQFEEKKKVYMREIRYGLCLIFG